MLVIRGETGMTSRWNVRGHRLHLAWLFLLAIPVVTMAEVVLICRASALYAIVRRFPAMTWRRTPYRHVDRVAKAVDEVCVWWPRTVMCVPRAAALTCMLRLHGVPASMILACRTVPVVGHAWVEVDGVIVNDRAGYQKYFIKLAAL
jgi:hypothetical protein